MRALAAAALALLACGGAPPRPVEVAGRGEAAPRPLADDVAELERAVARPGYFPKHVTPLGWTTDRRLAYRSLLCAHDELGGRGNWCDLYVCAVGPAVGPAPVEPSCEAAAAFELYGELEFDPARVTADAEDAVARLGPLTPARARARTDVLVTLTERTLRFAALGQPAQVVAQPWLDSSVDEPVDPQLGVTDVEVAAVAGSADGACVGAVGFYGYRASYEAVYGRVPHAFGAVACAR